MKLDFTARALADLADIAAFIAHDNPPRARTFVDELEQRCRDLLAFPEVGALIVGRRGVRRIVHGRYLIFYRVEAKRVLILAVRAGEMDLDTALF